LLHWGQVLAQGPKGQVLAQGLPGQVLAQAPLGTHAPPGRSPSPGQIFLWFLMSTVSAVTTAARPDPLHGPLRAPRAQMGFRLACSLLRHYAGFWASCLVPGADAATKHERVDEAYARLMDAGKISDAELVQLQRNMQTVAREQKRGYS